MENQQILKSGRYTFWRLTSENFQEASTAIQSKLVDGVYLSQICGFDLPSLDILKDLPTFKALSIGDTLAKDISYIEQFSHLEMLSIDDGYIPLNLNCFQNLVELRIFLGKYQDLPSQSLGNLRTLYLSGYRKPDLNELGLFQSLEELFIYEAKKLTSLEGLGFCKKINYLEIGYCPNLIDVAAIGSLSNLEYLELTTLMRASAFADCLPRENLKKLIVKNLPPLESVSPFVSLNSLELLTLVDTEVRDGDLTKLLTMPSLDHCHIRPNKPQYYPKASIVYDLVKAKVRN